MRPVLALLVLVGGCITAEPGTQTQDASQRSACTDLEGRTFQGGVNNAQLVAFVADDAEYSTYTETAADGTQSMGIAQCISVSGTNLIYLDGAIDRHAARADVRNGNTTETFLQWTDGHWLTAY